MAGSLLVLDTNLLLLYLVSVVDLTLLNRFKRVSSFRLSDVLLLQGLVGGFRAMMTTPHILTETSNLVDQAPGDWRNSLIEALRQFAQGQREFYQASALLMNHVEFRRLALADTALVALSHEATVATLDYELYGRIIGNGGMAVHFDHLRGKNYA